MMAICHRSLLNGMMVRMMMKILGDCSELLYGRLPQLFRPSEMRLIKAKDATAVCLLGRHCQSALLALVLVRATRQEPPEPILRQVT